ncbi:anthranilate synthase component I family protein [Desulfosoma caldarium]|uniref:Anthranilate synthase component 1 n=1 Tax=Desulfosoma caldarium TaxID=610254 RepID=A0A3N1UY33_9BACT|nr:anthranilate synthase component I family protein [Desulfosoma caldarium]ROQ93600.1 anthranilate synthase component I [Desulfosoma caldarium]
MKLRFFPTRNEFKDLFRRGNLVPVCCEILADTETPVSALAKIRQPGRPVFLLESVEGGERWGRYSFLGASASRHVRLFRHHVEILENGMRRAVPHGGDPLQVLRSLMAPYRPVSVPGLPRFWGGLVGWIAYETVSFFEKIANALPPEVPLGHFVMTDELLIFDNVRHTLTLLVPVARLEETEDPSQGYDGAVARLESLAKSLENPLVVPSIPLDLRGSEPPSPAAEKGFGPPLFGSGTEAFQSTVSRENFLAMVRTVKDLIRAGDVIQTVLSQPFVLQPAPDPWFLYRAQRYINPSPYMFFMELDDRILVGSSPETMVRLENGVATLRPIAGTRPRGATEQEDRRLADELLKDPKERAEHLMLVDLGRNDLGRVAETGTVQVTDLMVVERYSHVMHLVSNITCDLRRDCDAWDLLRATFPAGTLTGAPKIRAMEIIADLEPTPRGPYGGAVGYIAYTGNMDLAITIRTACLNDGTMTVQTGAGIVADSDPQREYEETVNKAKAMFKAVAVLRNAETFRH